MGVTVEGGGSSLPDIRNPAHLIGITVEGGGSSLPDIRNPAHLIGITVGGGPPVLQIAVTLLTL
jgi:hypothetical protein